MSLLVQEYVFRFDVPVDDLEGMQMFQCQKNLRPVKQGCGCRELLQLFESRKQFPALDVFEEEVDVVAVLEDLIELHHKGMARFLQNRPFLFQVLQLSELYYFAFVQGFQSEADLGGLLLVEDLLDGAEGPSSDRSPQHELLDSQLGLSLESGDQFVLFQLEVFLHFINF